MLVKKTVYIREEDLKAWANVSNKAAFLHDALHIGITTIPTRSKTPDTPIPLPADEMDPTEFIDPKKLCKHGNPKGSCFHKESARLKCN